MSIFVPRFGMRIRMTRIYTRGKMKINALHMVMIGRLVLMAMVTLLSVNVCAENEPVYAGITVALATTVTDTMQLRVQDGGNYLKVAAEHLPATFVYVSDSAFGPLPVATVMGDTMPASVVFSGCRMSRVWTVARPADDAVQLVSVMAHEDATLYVYPIQCPGDEQTMAEAWDSLAWHGTVYTESGDYTDTITTDEGCRYQHTLHLTVHKTLFSRTELAVCDSLVRGGKVYTESGEYILDTVALESGDRMVQTLALKVSHRSFGEKTVQACMSYAAPSGKVYRESGIFADTTVNAAGCDSIITLRLTIDQECLEYDTVYFCRGLNTEHVERISDGLMRRYVAYVYESPAAWDYMDGVIVSSEGDRSLVDLRRAETNLLRHYVRGLEPVADVTWSYLPKGGKTYQNLTAGVEPQWIASGVVTIQVTFVCGHTYRNAFNTGTQATETVATDERPVKIIRDGQVVIVRGNAAYTPLGQKLQ